MSWPELSWEHSPLSQAHFTLGIVGMIFLLLMVSQVTPDLILIFAVTILLVAGILTPGEALAGMSNEGMITVGVLFVVGAGCAKRAELISSLRACWPPENANASHRPHDVPHDGFERVHE